MKFSPESMPGISPGVTPVAPPPRLSAWIVVLLVLAYALPGILGHDPWKPDEPYTFGAVLDMLKSGDWVVPTVTGSPFVEKPPLFFWLASVTASLASPLLPLHDGARLASLLCLLASVGATAGAARLCWGDGAGALAALLFLSALGLEGHAQRLQVDLALLAGFSFALLGFAACIRDRRWGGVALGAGIGAGFLAKGVFAPAVIGVTALLLPLFFKQWRTRRYAMHLLEAFAIAAPALLIWPLALQARSETLFHEWLNNNFGRFNGYYLPGAVSEQGLWGASLAWVLFPLWVYAAAAIAIERRKGWLQPGMQIGFTMAFVAALVLAISASMRAIYVLPMIPPLALASVAALRRPDGVLEKTLAVASTAFAVAGAVLVWSAWAMLAIEGRIPKWLPFSGYLTAEFAMPISIVPVAAALALSAGFAALVVLRRRLAASGLAIWVGSIACVWGLAHTLWLPWLDDAKSYRTLFAELAQHLPPGTRCIVTAGVGESERAMIEYYADVMPRPRASNRQDDCPALLLQVRKYRDREPPKADVWQPVWRGARRGDVEEAFALYVRR